MSLNNVILDEIDYFRILFANIPCSLVFNKTGAESHAAREDTAYISFLFPSYDKQLGACINVFTGTLVVHFYLSLCGKRNPNHEFYHTIFQKLVQSNYSDLITNNYSVHRGRITYTIAASKVISTQL
jgi:hypothetical protein